MNKMGNRLGRTGTVFAMAAFSNLFAVAVPAIAQVAPVSSGASASSSASLTLYEDPVTHQLFTVPGRGRRPFAIPLAALAGVQQKAAELEKSQQELKRQMEQQREEAQTTNATLARQVRKMEPGWKDYISSFRNRFRIGTLMYMDYAMMTRTGFGPQLLTQMNWPGPGNDYFNAFQLTRSYINIFFQPTKHWTVRVTPNIYTNYATTPGVAAGRNTAFPSFPNSLVFRLKYGYIDYDNLFGNSEHFSGTHLILGQAPEPLVPWEEDLYGFRYVNLVPWNYMGFSSTFLGMSVAGPIKFNGLTYIDYQAGVYNEQSFSQAIEQGDTKQVMARASYYPMGAAWRFQGLGLTSFIDYGWGNSAPSMNSIITPFKAPNSRVTRIAALLHYTTATWGLAGEFDWAHNGFTSGNLFTGSGPADAFGLGPTPYAGFTAMAASLLNNGQAEQAGFDFFGHYHIPHTPFTPFMMFQQMMPNIKVHNDPLDFQRLVIGVSYQYNEYLRFALDLQNIFYYNGQYNMPTAYVKTFAPLPVSVKGPFIINAVPQDTHAIMANVEFAY